MYVLVDNSAKNHFKILFCCADFTLFGNLFSQLAKIYTITICNNVSELLSIVNTCFYNMALVQVTSCDNDFSKCLKDFRSHYPQIIVILINGHLHQSFLVEAFKMGIKDYFPEPVDINLLYERIISLSSF